MRKTRADLLDCIEELRQEIQEMKNIMDKTGENMTNEYTHRKKSIPVIAHYIGDYKDYIQMPLKFIGALRIEPAYRKTYVICDTASGEMKAELPTWIIAEESRNGCYPCSPAQFDILYEAIP